MLLVPVLSSFRMTQLLGLFIFISIIQNPGSFITPPLLSLHPQGLNNF